MLYQDIRPKTVDDVLGNKAVVGSLRQIIALPAVDRPHTLLFQGPSGCGKTTLARIFAKAVGCKSLDMHEMNAANTRGIDSVRRIAETSQLLPMSSAAVVYILDESHQLTPAAQEALLKMTEDTPKHLYFILCTTEPQHLIETLRNRCTVFPVSPLRPPEALALVQQAAKYMKVEFDLEVAKAVAQVTDGCPRAALVLAEQIATVEDVDEIKDLLNTYRIAEREFIELARAIIDKGEKRWFKVKKIYTALASKEPYKLQLGLMGYFKACMLRSKTLEETARFAELIRVIDIPYPNEPRLLGRLFEACLL